MALVILLVGFYYLKTKTPSFKQDQPETKSEIRDTSNDSETISLEDKPEFKSIVNIQNSDTANWKTYLDLKTKVSFKYPQKYVYSDVFYKRTGNLSFFESKENMLDAEKNAIEGCGGCNFLINISEEKKDPGNNLENFLVDKKIDTFYFFPTEVDSIKAFRSEVPGYCLNNQIYIDDGTRVININGCAMQKENQPLFNQILSTVKIIN